MNNIKIFFLSATSGKTEKGTYYKVTLNILESNDDHKRDFSVNFFVDVDTYAKAKSFTRFQEVDAVFMPTEKGFARLVSIEGL